MFIFHVDITIPLQQVCTYVMWIELAAKWIIQVLESAVETVDTGSDTVEQTLFEKNVFFFSFQFSMVDLL